MKATLTGRCRGCREHHDGSCCPPHEVRLTGIAWLRQYIEELEELVERLRAKVDTLERRRAG